ncbi:hypothetical protein L208DRAFT_1210713, partial [Tricholoma matsutake]
DKIKWFNSDMLNIFKDGEATQFSGGDTWGLFTTDSFGMRMDIPDVELVVQWKATCMLSTLWQIFGRAGGDPALEATAVFFIEKEHFNEICKKK